jgi:RNA polymerase sigma factor (sigma-70 family)
MSEFKNNESLAVQAQTGDKQASDTLITQNMRLVYDIAKKFDIPGQTKEDIQQAGFEGLCKAVATFDNTRGVKFSTHATWQVKGKIMEMIPKAYNVPRSSRYAKVLWKISDTYGVLSQELNREPTNQEMADRIGVALDVYETAAERYHLPDTSMDSHNAEYGTTLHEVIGKEEDGEEYFSELWARNWARDLADAFVKTLTEDERVVWAARIDCEEPTSARTVGQQIGCSHQTILNTEADLRKRFQRRAWKK